jgi:hypothetical protein
MILAMHAIPVSLIPASVMIHKFGSVIDSGNASFAGVIDTYNVLYSVTRVVDTGVAPSEPLTVRPGL